MGSETGYPEEAPQREMFVEPFAIDRCPVTNRQFSAFIAATGYATTAEQLANAEFFSEIDPVLRKAGSSVFMPTDHPVSLLEPWRWWSFVPGASWKHPLGPGSDLAGLLDHPVVHVSWFDAIAFAEWDGTRLPTEAEWEFAARGGLDRRAYAWGDHLEPADVPLANYWQGPFPQTRERWQRTSTVGSYPANGFGLFDTIGNVWEWTADWYGEHNSPSGRGPSPQCCTPHSSLKATEDSSRKFGDPREPFGSKVIKGGSHLCAPSYCQRYRPAARHAQPIDSTTSHIGFRCARSVTPGS